MYTRLAKAIAVGCFGLMALLAGLDNIIDYDSNFPYVQHVLSMDTVFEESTLKSRAIRSEPAHVAAFASIIAAELVCAVLCLWSAVQLFRTREDPIAFQRQKRFGVVGLTVGLLLWFFGFYVIGGEWFVSWQSERWNSTPPGLQLSVLILLILLFLTSAERETGR